MTFGAGPDLVGIGASVLDLLFEVASLPRAEGVQRAHQVAVDGGGPVATALVAAQRMGLTTAMIDVVGDDWAGREVLALYDREGVDRRRVRVERGRTSPTACVLVDRATAGRAIAYHPGTVGPRGLEPEDRRLIAGAACFHTNGRHWPACLEAATLARDAGVPVSFDGGAGRYRPELRPLAEMADICIVAAAFATAMTGERDPPAAVRAMARAGSGLVAVTDGARGSWVLAPGESPFHQPAFRPSRLVDTTGCGDAYHGAFLAALHHGLDARGAARTASAAAAMVAGELGGRRGLPSWPEARSFAAATIEI